MDWVTKLYKEFGDEKEIPEEIESISLLFGITQLNFNLPITLFEGPFDSFLFRNSVASAGANKEFPIEIPLRYWFDSDETGIKKAVQYIERGEYVFLWEKLKRDIDLPYKRKWDLNDLLLYLKNNGIKAPMFDNYFSNDPLDLIEI